MKHRARRATLSGPPHRGCQRFAASMTWGPDRRGPLHSTVNRRAGVGSEPRDSLDQPIKMHHFEHLRKCIAWRGGGASRLGTTVRPHHSEPLWFPAARGAQHAGQTCGARRPPRPAATADATRRVVLAMGQRSGGRGRESLVQGPHDAPHPLCHSLWSAPPRVPVVRGVRQLGPLATGRWPSGKVAAGGTPLGCSLLLHVRAEGEVRGEYLGGGGDARGGTKMQRIVRAFFFFFCIP